MMPITLALAAAVLVLIYLLARTVNELMFVRDRLQCESDTEHAKCMGAVMKYVGDEFAAQVLVAAAQDYESVEEQGHLRTLANLRYQPGGPSMPAIWLEERAEKLRILAAAQHVKEMDFNEVAYPEYMWRDQ